MGVNGYNFLFAVLVVGKQLSISSGIVRIEINIVKIKVHLHINYFSPNVLTCHVLVFMLTYNLKTTTDDHPVQKTEIH